MRLLLADTARELHSSTSARAPESIPETLASPYRPARRGRKEETGGAEETRNDGGVIVRYTFDLINNAPAKGFAMDD